MSYDIDVYTPRGMPYIRNEQDTYIEDVSRRKKSYKKIYFKEHGYEPGGQAHTMKI